MEKCAEKRAKRKSLDGVSIVSDGRVPGLSGLRKLSGPSVRQTRRLADGRPYVHVHKPAERQAVPAPIFSEISESSIGRPLRGTILRWLAAGAWVCRSRSRK